MKNKKWIILVIAVLLAMVGIIHTTISYVNILNDQYTSLPATVALLLLIPYAVCSVICLIVWMVIKQKERRNKKD